MVTAAIVLGVVYGGMCCALFFGQGRFVYYPVREVAATPADLGLAYEEITLQSTDGERLAAWFVPASETNRNGMTVLKCHGNAGNVGNRVWNIQALHRLGFDVLMFDYRGFGASSGTPSEEGTYRDADAAWRYLTEGRGVVPERIVLYGRSLGAAVASQLAMHVKPRLLVLESGFASAGEMARGMFPWLPARLLCRYGYDTARHLTKVSCPVLIAHSPQDEVVPFAHAAKLRAAVQVPCAMVELSGGHNTGGLEAQPEYQRWFRKLAEEPDLIESR
jgi:pimeloyl-ACP methyl ester carboxylesterase